MKEFKGTKGKWLAEESPVTKGFWSVGSGDTDITYLTLNPDEVEANAKLIASAPELLEALILARAVILSKRDMDGLSPKGSEILNKINSAINKALS